MAEEERPFFKNEKKSVSFHAFFLCFDDGVSSKFQQKLLRADVSEIDGGFRVLAVALDICDGADAESLMLDDVSDFQGAIASR